MAKTIILIGTFDTKGEEYAFLYQQLKKYHIKIIIIDIATSTSSSIAIAEGDSLHSFLKNVESNPNEIKRMSRGDSVQKAAGWAEIFVAKLYQELKFDGIIALGGSGGTTIATSAMRALPLGIPKVMVSTMASGNIQHYIGTSDITMIYSVTDIAGLNRFTKVIISNAANALVGMINNLDVNLSVKKRPLVGLTMFGVTTKCVDEIRKILEKNNCECVVFHATGSGGRAMEKMIEDGFVSAVCDVTTTEWADELVGGILTAGPHRLEAAAEKGIPQVVSVGALDMVNFGPIYTIPEKFKDRKLCTHNETVTLMRTTPQENTALGKVIAEKLNKAKGPVMLYFPLRGISAYDQEKVKVYFEKKEIEFNDPVARSALLNSLKANLNHNRIKLIELDLHINDLEFAQAMANGLLQLMSPSIKEEGTHSNRYKYFQPQTASLTTESSININELENNKVLN